jgi:antitoxin component YwqK of YwqJK toxin-antitoxin module
MKFLLILLTAFITIGFSSCKTNKTINHHREGKWVFQDTVNGVLYKSKGKYKQSQEIKMWKYFEDCKLVKTEKYEDNICHIKTFDEKGRTTSIGKSMIVEERNETHWCLTGDWIFFDEKGKIIGIKKYEKGELISEIEM